MAMKMKEIEYGAPAKQILAIPDHYVALGQQHNKVTEQDKGLAVQQDGRWIVRAGTIYPSNDSFAQGIVLNDYDVTDGDAMLAIVKHGFIKQAALPEMPSTQARIALKDIYFVDAIGLPTVGVLNYDKPLYNYPDGEGQATAYNLVAHGHQSALSVSKTANVDFDISVTGIAPKFLDGVRAGLGFPDTTTHAIVVLIEIPYKKGILFNAGKVKFKGNAVAADNLEYRNGKWYVTHVQGLKADANGKPSPTTKTFTFAYDDEDATTYQWDLSGLNLEV